ncbi:MAG: amino acid transporter [Chloroflexi bacterium]|nr:amino acid transporter [Chloroflexota bacterium]
MISAFLHGYLLSFGLILPLGPQNTFVFTQGATQPKLIRAIPVAVAASLADTFLILLAVFGVSVIVLTIPIIKTILTIIGIAFLLYIGWVTWKSEPTNNESHSEFDSLKKRIVFALSVSLLNPHAILDTIGVIGTSAVTYTGSERFAVTFACILNSWLWCFGLTIMGRSLGVVDRNGRVLKVLNKVSAVIIWVSAIYLIKQLLDLSLFV